MRRNGKRLDCVWDDRDSSAADTLADKRVSESLANCDYLIGAGQRPWIQRVIQAHFEILRRVTVMKANPTRLFGPHQAEERMRFDSVSFDDVGPLASNQGPQCSV